MARRSGRRVRARVSPDHLGRLAEGAQEGAAHPIALREAGLPGADFDRVAAVLHHQASGLDAQALDRLGRRLAGLCAEDAAELARTQARRLGELPHRKWLIEAARR